MKTSKPFATISYNSKEFLINHLNEQLRLHNISFWSLILHTKEEENKKDHWHVYVVPNGRIDTDLFLSNFQELDTNNPLIPLKCMPANSAKFADWYLYVLHDKNYLAFKKMTRKYHYTKEEIITSDNDYLNELIDLIDYTKINKQAQILSRLAQGEKLVSLINTGEISISQITQYIRYLELLDKEDYDTKYNTRKEKIKQMKELIEREDNESPF